MTIKEIAEVANVNEKTIREWIKRVADNLPHLSDKMSDAYKNKKPADFTLGETIEIVRAGGNTTLADLLLENANRNRQKKRSVLPNGKQLEEIRRIYGNREAARRLDYLLGFCPNPEAIPPEHRPVSKEEGERQFALIKRKFDRYEKTGKAIAERMRKRDQEKAEADEKQMKLEDLN